MTRQTHLRAVPKEPRRLIKAAIKAGWTVRLTSGSHFRITPADPAKGIITTSGSPSDHRSVDNLRADLRRAGLNV